jgi:hypothetical protein
MGQEGGILFNQEEEVKSYQTQTKPNRDLNLELHNDGSSSGPKSGNGSGKAKNFDMKSSGRSSGGS